MQSMLGGLAQSRFSKWMAIPVFTFILVFLFSTLSSPQEHNMGSMPEMSMPSPSAPETQAQVAKRLADRQESEFNHHLAGLFVILAGIFILSENYVARRWTLARYAWPMCFLAVGLFVLIFSDTEIWPFGPQTPWYALTHNVEDLQHKIFSVILLVIGYVELQRARGRLNVRWAVWLFPAVGVTGATLLLFHIHSGNMGAPHAMEAMEHIQKQHRWFAATGFGVALANGLAGTPQRWQQFFKKVWPLLLITLGILLILYTE